MAASRSTKAKPGPGKSAADVRSTASKAKTPLVAGGAALAGAAGGIALGSKLSGRRVLGVRLPKPKRVQVRSREVAEAAKSAAGVLDQIGRLAGGVRDAQDSNGRHPSPLEVLLQGLTHRR